MYLRLQYPTRGTIWLELDAKLILLFNPKVALKWLYLPVHLRPWTRCSVDVMWCNTVKIAGWFSSWPKNKWSLSSDSTRIVDSHPSNENKIKTAARDLLVTQLKFGNFDPDYSLFVCCAVLYCMVLSSLRLKSLHFLLRTSFNVEITNKQIAWAHNELRVSNSIPIVQHLIMYFSVNCITKH